MEDKLKNKFTAFISYNSADDKLARWLQKQLESYKLPTVIADEKGNVLKSYSGKQRKMRIFRYVSDLVAQNLNDGLRQELDRSQYLIVVCSPRSAQSEWVGKEIKHFVDTDRSKKIIPFIVEGTPYSGGEDECFNPELIKAFPNGELLGVNLNENGDDYRFMRRRKAVAKTVSLLLGLPDAYDFIWNRYRKSIIVKWALRLLLALLAVAAVIVAWTMNSNFNTTITLNEATKPNANLPTLGETKLTLYLDNETKETTLTGLSSATFTNVPRALKGRKVRITLSCVSKGLGDVPDYLPLDTTVVLGEDIKLNINRNPAKYGTINAHLWNPKIENSLPNTMLSIAGIETKTDSEGNIKMLIPLDQQRTSYPVTCSLPLECDSVLPGSEKVAIIVK
ncbi:MAG: toll/interleukin-1 receptor domain-containing protein [Muribaculaceae bacterium]|nr:toll/interleukin-1 receptor domain-containing protein [Muribaculaceae bacterium]